MYTFQSRVKKRIEEITPETNNWMMDLRKNHTPFKFESNPFVEVFQLREGVFSLFSESADGMGDPWQHLILGSKKAFLIDTGFGIGDLLSVVKQLIGSRELIVAITHEHLDHYYGNFQFDTVYCHELALPILEATMKADIWDNLFDAQGIGLFFNCNHSDCIPYKPYTPIGCKHGTIFDLGDGYIVELLHTPGHAPGGASYLDYKHRILFTGALHSNYVSIGTNPRKRALHPFGNYASIPAFLHSLNELEQRLDSFDSVFPAHEILGLDPSIIIDTKELCHQIMADPESYDFVIPNKHKQNVKYKEYKSASIRYLNESLTG